MEEDKLKGSANVMGFLDFFFGKKTTTRKAIIVAEINFDRNASSEKLRELGESLLACTKIHGWISHITGLDSLLLGQCPTHLHPKGSYSGGKIVHHYDAILVWGKTNYPGTRSISPVEVLAAEIKSTIGHVTFPDPDNGL